MNQILVNCFSGLYALLQDLAGTFSLIVFAGLLALTFIKPQLGSMALAAFCTSAPALIAYCQHKIALQTLIQQASSSSSNNLPPKGTL